ncbi:hypothetical protein [Streptomyces sp. BA2]|uniref:hypothetical protein n=1 Tax=Streptomyces sp. BA2 TaxID=436595 RepID=UPI001324D6F4|nr:hypothetical protein [Streptomyces sp. BA2]MWA07743.1 hypothetical protein [Streptomyces sp. BA2]
MLDGDPTDRAVIAALVKGVPSGFTAQLKPQRVGLGARACVLLTVDQNAWRSVSELRAEVPYAEHFSLVGGDFDVLVLTRTWLVFDESPDREPAERVCGIRRSRAASP